MKKTAIILLVAFSLALATSSSYAGRGHGHYNYPRHHYYYRHYDRHYYRHYYHDLATAGIVLGAVFLGGVILNALTSPPPRAVYVPQYVVREPHVRVLQPGVCFQERKVGGEWQRSPYDGSLIWVTYPYPIPRRIQVPCY